MEERALVTGAASGIGRAMAQRLVDDGRRVLSVDVAIASLHGLVRTLTLEGAAGVAVLLGDAGRAFTGAAVPMEQRWSAR